MKLCSQAGVWEQKNFTSRLQAGQNGREKGKAHQKDRGRKIKSLDFPRNPAYNSVKIRR